MTLAEKVGQINMPCVYVGGLGSDVPSKTEEARAVGIHELCTLVVEPGTFQVMVGHSSKDIRLKDTFEVAGH